MGDHLKLVEAFQPDAFECLCDSSPSIGNKPKRVRKSVDRTLRFLDETVEARANSKVSTLVEIASAFYCFTLHLVTDQCGKELVVRFPLARRVSFQTNSCIQNVCLAAMFVAFLLRVICLCALRHCRGAACWGPLKAVICWKKERDQLLKLH